MELKSDHLVHNLKTESFLILMYKHTIFGNLKTIKHGHRCLLLMSNRRT